MSRSPTVPTTLSVKGHATAFGLRWEALAAQSPRAATSQLVKQMKAHGVRYAVLSESDGNRFVGGLFLATPTQRVSKTFSAAAWLAESRRKPAIVVAELGPSTLWVGVIDPGVWLEGDFVGNKEEAALAIDGALDHFERIGEQPELLVCSTRPDGSAMHEYPMTAKLAQLLNAQGLTDPTFCDWESLLSSKPPADALVTQFTGVDARTSWALIGLAAVGALAFLGHALWSNYQAEQERLRFEAELAAQAATQGAAGLSQDDLDAEREKRKAQAIAAALQRHTMTPEPMAIIHLCASSVSGLGVQLRGWTLTELGCDGVAVTANWTAPAQIGTATLAEHVLQELERVGPTTLTVDATGRMIQAAWSLGAQPARPTLRVSDLDQATPLSRLLLARSQLQTAGSRQAVAPWNIAVPAPADISFLDPALEADVNNPARFVQVLPPEGFRVASLTASGVGIWRLKQLPLDLRAVTVRRVVFRPVASSGGQDVIPWSVEADYVVQ